MSRSPSEARRPIARRVGALLVGMGICLLAATALEAITWWDEASTPEQGILYFAGPVVGLLSIGSGVQLWRRGPLGREPMAFYVVPFFAGSMLLFAVALTLPLFGVVLM